MLTTKKPVWTRPARLLVNVFWTAITVAVKLVVSLLIGQNTLNVHVRFVESISKAFQWYSLFYRTTAIWDVHVTAMTAIYLRRKQF